MKKIFLAFVLLMLNKISIGQTVEETYPKTLWCSNDSFAIKFKGFSQLSYFTVSRKDKISPGMDAATNQYATIYFDNDSLQLNYNNNLPYQHNIYINFASPKGKTTLRFHFNQIRNYFPADYMETNMNNIQFDIPEIYELANIIWTLSPSGQRANDLNKEGAYYQRVVAHFKPFLNHPIFRALDFSDSLYIKKYYDFRENSFAFNFQDSKLNSSNTKILFNGPYYHVFGDELADSSLFGKLKPMIEDFAAKSKFKQFYKSNLDYYKKEIQRQKELLPVKKMWNWLEAQFPQTKYQSYRIVFSPLIGGAHSTQRYSTYSNSQLFGENVMFVCNTDRYDKMPDISEKQKEGLMSGIVFTEIDHNYVNPATTKYTKLVDSIFSNRSVWTKQGNYTDYYGSSVSIFNEYMTHAVFCLYILDTYEKPIADFVIDKREELMVKKRNFIAFKEFNKELIRLKRKHSDLKAIDLYPFILDWCKRLV